MCIPVADSCWCMAETNTAIVKQLSSNLKIKKRKSDEECSTAPTVL